jgi:hypothetical protein
MSAPKGNTFAIGNNGGRPSKLSEEVVVAAEGYMAWVEANPIIVDEGEGKTKEKPRLPNVERCALLCKVGSQTLRDWAEGRLPAEFLTDAGRPNAQGEVFSVRLAWVLRTIKDAQKSSIVELGTAKVYDSTMARFIGSAEHDMREKTDMTTDGKAFNLTVMKFDEEHHAPSPVSPA